MAFRLILFVLLSSFIACNSDTKPKTGKKGIANPKNKTTKVKRPGNDKANADTYWVQLQKATGITKAQVVKIKAIEAATKKEINKARKNKTLTAEVKKRLNQNSRQEISKLLGKKLNAKKIAFDKKWNKKSK